MSAYKLQIVLKDNHKTMQITRSTIHANQILVNIIINHAWLMIFEFLYIL